MTNDKDSYLNQEEISEILLKINHAREIQLNRYQNSQYKTNASASNTDLLQICKISDSAKNLLTQMDSKKMIISSRSYFKIIKIARTIADFEDSEILDEKHIFEAVQYRESIS